MAWTSEPEVIKGAIIAPPPEAPKKPRNPRSPKKVAKAAEGILAAIGFVEGATDDSQDFQNYVRIAGGWIVAYDGSVAAGHRLEEDFEACPHLKRLKEAVSRAGATLALSVQDNGRLAVTGDKLKATVPCMAGSSLFPVMPDVPIAKIDDRLKAGFAAVVALAKDEAETVHESSALLRANTVVGCNGNLAIEYWHGIDLPPGMGIPHKAVKIIAKQKLALEAFGWDQGRSVTFHFEGGAWIKTQLMSQEWPDIDRVLNKPAYCADAPEGLFEALDAILSFSEDGAVHFHEGKLKSTYAEAAGGALVGASYEVPGLQKGSAFTGRLLKLAMPAAKQIDYTTHDDCMMLLNMEANLRGVLMKRRA